MNMTRSGQNMGNPFQQAPPAQAPAQQQYAPPAAQDPNAVMQNPAAQQQFPGQVTPAELQADQRAYAQPVQQQFAPQHVQQATGYAAPQQQAPAQGLPGQPWSPQQHEAYGQMREGGASAGTAYANVQQAYAPPAPPVQQPPAAPQGFPQAPFPGQQAPAQGNGFPGAPAAMGGGFDPSLFGAPSAGGGTFPKVRDLDGRLCLFRVKRRDAQGTAYGDPTKSVTNYVANVAVLDGGPLYSSGSQDDPLAQPTLVSETTPYVIGDMTIGQVGIQGRLKQDYVRGRVVRMPKGEFEKGLMTSFPGMEPWQALWTWLSQDVGRVHQLKPNSYFWGIVVDDSPQANQLVAEFAQNPVSRELML